MTELLSIIYSHPLWTTFWLMIIGESILGVRIIKYKSDKE